MTAAPLTSVVIPARDAKKTLGRTLESLLAQTSPRWEAFIVDDGSVDGTFTIIADYAARDARFVALRSAGEGVSAARNLGISRVSGERILFLDSDDWIDRQFLAKMNAALDSNPSAVAAYCNYCRVMPDGSETPVRSDPRVEKNPFEVFARTCASVIHGILVKKSAVLKVGGFDTGLRTGEDWDLWQRIARVGGDWIHVDEKLSFYRASEHSLTQDVQQMLADAKTIIARGFSNDDRVGDPAPAHRTGASTAHDCTAMAPATETYALFALWCAGADIGRGKASRPSQETLAALPKAEASADAIADVLLDAVMVGSRMVPARLAEAWDRYGPGVTNLIAAIGQAWNDPPEARRIQYRFERMLLDYDDLAAPRIFALTLGLRVDLRQLPAIHPPNNIDRLYVYLCDGPRILALLDVGLLGEVDRDFWARLVTEHLARLHIEVRKRWRLRHQSKPAKLIRHFRRLAGSNPDSHQHRLAALQERISGRARSRRASRPSTSGSRENHAVDKSSRDTGRELFWEAFFQNEDPWNYGSSYEQEKYRRQLELLPPEPPERALELACAEGHFTRQLAPKVEHLLAADISTKALNRARSGCSTHRNVDFVKLDLSADDLPGEMDLIFCSEVLYFLNDQAELELVAKKLSQALRPGGHLIAAHAFVLSDNMSRTGFDWENPYGAETIARVMEKMPDLAMEVSTQTELYRIDRYKRLLPGEAAPDPQVRVAHIDSPIEREVARYIVRNGAVTRRSEVAQSERRQHVPVLMYHRIATDGPEEFARYRLSPDAFADQMSWLRRNGYHTINSEQLAWFVVNDHPFVGRPLLITFDDGYDDFAEQAWPALKANDLSAEVFIVTDMVGGSAEWDASFGTSAPLM